MIQTTWINMGSLTMRINMVCVYHKVFSAVNYWLKPKFKSHFETKIVH